MNMKIAKRTQDVTNEPEHIFGPAMDHETMVKTSFSAVHSRFSMRE